MNHYHSLFKVPPPPLPPPIEEHIDIERDPSITCSETRAKVGKPVGLKKEKKKSVELAIIRMKNEIATYEHKVMRTLEREKQTTKGALASIVHDINQNISLYSKGVHIIDGVVNRLLMLEES